MKPFGKSQPIRRIEDQRFLTGAGQFVDDIAPDGAAVAYFLRAPVAHAIITTLDVSDARDADGVLAVLTYDDLVAAGIATDLPAVVIKNRDGSPAANPKRPLLCDGHIRHVGEAIAVIVADTLDQAKDAAELIELDYDDLPVALDLTAGGAALHAEAGDNMAFDWAIGDAEQTDAAFADAAHVVSLQVGDNRIIANSLEPRGCFAQWDGHKLEFTVNGQGVWNQKNRLVQTLGLTPEQVRVINPDVGGGFGMKAMTYPEYYVVAHAAMALGRAIRWMADRTESMLTDNAGRDLVSDAEIALDADLRITGYRMKTRCNLGAYNSQFGQIIQTDLFAKVLTGPYDIPVAHHGVQGFYTNTTPVDAYRGAGRPEAIYVMERLMDRAARELGVDPWDLRRKNLIAADKFPYHTVAGETYDVGDFIRVLDRAHQVADVAGFGARQAASASAGRLRGLGICYYIESILGAPSETTRVVFNDDDTATIFVGTQSNGQGHETVFSQFLSDQTGIPLDKIRFVQGDSDAIAMGGGTGGSRSVTVQNTATLKTVDIMMTAYRAFLAEKMGVDADDITFDDERFRAPNSNLSPTILEAAAMARDAGRDDLLDHTATITLYARSFPNGAHVAEVEIDPDTGVTRVDRYTVVDDFGHLINPLLVEGQVHGGIAQGLGQALNEHVVFDETGQLLTATFMDYAMPRAKDMPWVSFQTECVPSTANPMGVKGCGEAGTVGSMAAVANAVQDALWDRGVRQADMPFTPQRVWNMISGTA